MSERYIVMRNWERFQHYKDRSPTWIKNYTELLHDEGYRSLSGHQRGLLHGLWLEYASARAHLTLSTRSLTRRLGLRVMMRDLDALSHAGFIAFSASAPLAQRYPRDRDRSTSLRKYLEAETVEELPVATPNGENPLVEKLLSEIRDADQRTALVLHDYGRKLPEAAFASALESLQYRRTRDDRQPLESEARYVVSTLKTMVQEHQYL